jgi:hypothetical protein
VFPKTRFKEAVTLWTVCLDGALATNTATRTLEFLRGGRGTTSSGGPGRALAEYAVCTLDHTAAPATTVNDMFVGACATTFGTAKQTPVGGRRGRA